jgi:hypothetical protein
MEASDSLVATRALKVVQRALLGKIEVENAADAHERRRLLVVRSDGQACGGRRGTASKAMQKLPSACMSPFLEISSQLSSFCFSSKFRVVPVRHRCSTLEAS